MTVQDLLKSHPDWPAVKAIYHTLVAHGYKAFLAGGCVRDALLGKMAHDLDLATDAKPEEVESLFHKTIAVGKSFGVIRVLEENADIEVASFRADGPYEDGRRPDSVQWTSPDEDAKRRDFTVNAMFWDLESEVVVDYVKGLEDLKTRNLRAVGDPERRFQEDHLRLLRAIRFAGQLDFNIEPQTFLAIQNKKSNILKVSGERLREEMTKLLSSKSANRALELLFTSGLQQEIFPYLLKQLTLDLQTVRESWQAWILFFETSSPEQCENSLRTLKFSNKEMNWILEGLKMLHNPSGFFKKRLGLQLEALQDPSVVFSLQELRRRGQAVAQIEVLENAWQSLEHKMPAPFLRGEDVKEILKGPEIRACLQIAYWEQLEGHLKTRDEALIWLQDYFKKRGPA